MFSKPKTLFKILLNLYLAFSFVNIAYAQTSGYDYASNAHVSDQIKQFLCAPSAPANNTSVSSGSSVTYSGSNGAANGDLYNCINRLYKFAIVTAGVVGVFFIVIAGYLYIGAGGSQESVDKAKNILQTTITSLVILFAGYILLKAINPDLIQFRSIQPPSVDLNRGGEPSYGSGFTTGLANGSGSPGSINLSSGPINSNVCKVNQGGCNVNQLSQCSSWDANSASAICYIESGHGNPAAKSGSDVCKDGNSWSIGLFQINIIAHGGNSYMPAVCKKGIIQTFGSGTQGECLQRNSSNNVCVKYNCQVVDQAAYDACVQALSQPQTNISVACSLYQQANWRPWAYTYNLCRQN